MEKPGGRKEEGVTRRGFLAGGLAALAAASAPKGAEAAIGALAARHPAGETFLALTGMLDVARAGDREYLRLLEKNARGSILHASEIIAATDRSYVREATGMTAEEIMENPDALVSYWREDPRPVIRAILDRRAPGALARPVYQMNRLHARPPGERLGALRGMRARTLYEIIVAAGEEAYLSTAQLLYHASGYEGPEAAYAFIPAMRRGHASLAAFIRSIDPEASSFAAFLDALSGNDLLDACLADMGSPEEQQALISRYLFEGGGGMSELQAVTVDELLHAAAEPVVRDFMLNRLRGEYEAHGPSSAPAGAVLAEYFRGTGSPAWAEPVAASYAERFPDLSSFGGVAAFRREGGVDVQVQQHFFYDDRGQGTAEGEWDGHHSFRHFLSGIGISVRWDASGAIRNVSGGSEGVRMTDEGDYVLVRKRNGAREIRIYANKPDRDDETVARLHEQLSRESPPQIVVHRGHSYHAPKTIAVLSGSVSLVNFGSCGGAKNIAAALERAPHAQVIATQGVGTMLVNDVLLRVIDETLLRAGAVEWKGLRQRMEREFAYREGEIYERWGRYRLPDQNRAAHLIAALRSGV